MNAKHYKTFEWPVFELDTALQQNNPHQKLKEKTRVEIYLGKSPPHGRNISLDLSLTTGLVSPNFHIKRDPSFDVVHANPIIIAPPIEHPYFPRAG